MSIVDFRPFYRGFRDLDRLADSVFGAIEETAAGPAYDIEQHGETGWVLRLAVPGYAEGELEVVAKDHSLTVKGKPAAVSGEAVKVIHRGIAKGAFERRFALGEHVRVAGAKLDSGLLTIELAREVPEALKPRTIAIGRGQPAAQIAA